MRKRLVAGAILLSALTLSACQTTGQAPENPQAYIGTSDRHQAGYTDCLIRHSLVAHAKAGRGKISRNAVKAQCAQEQGEFYKAVWSNTFHGQRDNIQTSWRVATANAAVKIVDDEVFKTVEQRWNQAIAGKDI